jgi:hypothetical protein
MRLPTDSTRAEGRLVRRVLGVAVAGVIACGALAGCGGDEEGQKPKGVDLTALRCPLVSKGMVDGVEQFEPAKDAFDAASLIGKPLADAETEASEHGCNVVVSMEDRKGLPVSTEVDPTRILVHTEDGTVSEIEGVGGGL